MLLYGAISVPLLKRLAARNQGMNRTQFLVGTREDDRLDRLASRGPVRTPTEVPYAEEGSMKCRVGAHGSGIHLSIRPIRRRSHLGVSCGMIDLRRAAQTGATAS